MGNKRGTLPSGSEEAGDRRLQQVDKTRTLRRLRSSRLITETLQARERASSCSQRERGRDRERDGVERERESRERARVEREMERVE